MLEPHVPSAFDLFIAVVAASLVSAGLIVVLRPLLQRYALARPNARSSHKLPTPQGAGIAVIGATLLVTVIWQAVSGLAFPLTLTGAVLLIAIVGLVDDIRPIPVLPRLLFQIIAIGLVLLTLPSDLRMIPSVPIALERGAILLAGLWFVNLVNFMDGLDLMTVAEIVPVTAALSLLGWLEALPVLPTIVAATLCGALLGFSPFNRPVAKVFLGDVGSLPIGLLVGWCLLALAYQHHLIAALLLPLYYLADATLTLLRRIASGEPFWAAHRTHYYQLATDNGLAVTDVVGRVFMLNCVLAALAIASIQLTSPVVNGFALVAGTAAVAFVLVRFSTKQSH
ncbi:glycosyltransferase family 4 protein [Bradyrhizobium sp.]|uniref:MraY family glycosyltransferase n=1 Tax=Bradyrhizobium sp. TaxID=376 RepID=UPI001EC494C0|nr:glycosyltransferase family 4 protein [Bradyrhizobium sp.]MBV9983258.1 glycosyltransferase family 4 protein [Bradyrhizobium sp.]